MKFVVWHKWFHENHMVLNPGKCHYIVIDDDDPTHKICLNNNEIASSNLENLSWYLNNPLNSIHERALRLICNDVLPFDGILDNNKQKAYIKKVLIH